MEKISVIVPVYQVKEYLPECVASLCAQTYSDFEILLIDDGSRDGSEKLCEELSEQDQRIRVYHFENGGLSAARNRGIELAEGDWLAFVDADDVVNCRFLEKLYQLAEQYEAQIAVCEYLRGTDPEMVIARSGDGVKDGKGHAYYQYCLCSEQMLAEWHGKRKKIETVVWNKLYRRELFGDANQGIRFPEGKIHEDVYVSHLLVQRATRIAVSKEKLYFYRKRDGSLTNREAEKEKIRQSLEAQASRAAFFESHNYRAAYVRNIRGMLLHILKFWFILEWREKELRAELRRLFWVNFQKVRRIRKRKEKKK